MKNNKLTFQIILTVYTVVFTILYLVITLEYLSLALITQHGSFLQYVLYYLNFMVSTTWPLMIVFGLLFYFYLRPLQHAVNEIKSGGTIDEFRMEKAKKRMYNLPYFTISINFIAFMGGFILFAYLNKYLTEIFTIKIFSYFVFALAGSSIYSFVQTTVHNQILVRIRKLLNINYIDGKSKRREIGLQKKTVILSIIIIVYSLSFVIHKQFVVIENNKKYTDLMYSVYTHAVTLEQAKEKYTAYEEEKFGHYLNDKTHLASLFDKQKQDAILNDYGIFCIISFALFILVGFSSTYAFSRELVMQIKLQHNTMEEILQGRENLGKRINIIQFDEVGMLTNTINLFMDKLREILLEIETSSDSVTFSSETLNKDLLNASAAIEELVTSLDQITKNTTTQQNITETTRDQLLDIIEKIEIIFKNAAEQAGFVEETAAAMQEMDGSIKSITGTTSKADTLAGDLVQVAKDGEDSLGKVTEAINNIKSASDHVMERVALLSSISSQTDLLAMNAAIEAAHAGEAGKGFAVVADEIRKLAEDSQEQIGEITMFVKNMYEKIKNGVIMTEEANNAFVKIDNDVMETSNLIKEISSATQEQKISTSQILASVESVVRATEDVSAIASQLKEQSMDIKQKMEELFNISNEIAHATREQSTGNQYIVSLVNSVKEVSAKNIMVVNKLQSMIKGFNLHTQKIDALSMSEAS
jgi:methyl-accepting chemotaxis protein